VLERRSLPWIAAACTMSRCLGSDAEAAAEVLVDERERHSAVPDGVELVGAVGLPHSPPSGPGSAAASESESLPAEAGLHW
jgi:hypothetical protein